MNIFGWIGFGVVVVVGLYLSLRKNKNCEELTVPVDPVIETPVVVPTPVKKVRKAAKKANK